MSDKDSKGPIDIFTKKQLEVNPSKDEDNFKQQALELLEYFKEQVESGTLTTIGLAGVTRYGTPLPVSYASVGYDGLMMLSLELEQSRTVLNQYLLYGEDELED